MSLSATDRAYTWLRSSILSGELPSGSFVEEGSVCEATAVSRTPVREAFHRLAGERLMELVPRRGARVRDLSVRDVIDAFSARWVVESAAIGELLSDGNEQWDDVTERMSSKLAAMESTDVGSTHGQMVYIDLDKSFHLTFVAAMGNRALLDFYGTLWPLHEWSVLRARTNMSTFFEMVNVEHRGIYEAVRGRDLERARAVLFQHLRPFGG